MANAIDDAGLISTLRIAAESDPGNCSVSLLITHMAITAQARTMKKPGSPKFGSTGSKRRTPR